jgi:hypothetical protein
MKNASVLQIEANPEDQALCVDLWYGWVCAHLTHSWWSVFYSEEVVAFVAHSCIPVVGIGIPGCPGEMVGVV